MGYSGISLCLPKTKGKWDTYGSVNHKKVIIVLKKVLEACVLDGKKSLLFEIKQIRRQWW